MIGFNEFDRSVLLASAVVAALACSNLAAQDPYAPPQSAVTYYVNAERWEQGPWADPVHVNPDGDPYPIGAVSKWINSLPYMRTGWHDKTDATGAHSGQTWAADYVYLYLVPAGRSDLEGALVVRELLNGWDFGKLGTGNRAGGDGWGCALDPNASSTNPISRSRLQNTYTAYAPVAPPDEASVIDVTWQQKITLAAEITHKFPDDEMEEYLWVRPAVEPIDGQEVRITLQFINGSLSTVTSHAGGSVTVGTDGTSGTLQFGQSETYTSYTTFIANGELTKADHELVIRYSVAQPVPLAPMTTRHRFQWAAHIDDDNNIATVGLFADKNVLKYGARIQTSIRAKSILLVQSTQGTPYNQPLPGFAAPPFRDFAADPNLIQAVFSHHKQAVLDSWGSLTLD